MPLRQILHLILPVSELHLRIVVQADGRAVKLLLDSVPYSNFTPIFHDCYETVHPLLLFLLMPVRRRKTVTHSNYVSFLQWLSPGKHPPSIYELSCTALIPYAVLLAKRGSFGIIEGAHPNSDSWRVIYLGFKIMIVWLHDSELNVIFSLDDWAIEVHCRMAKDSLNMCWMGNFEGIELDQNCP